MPKFDTQGQQLVSDGGTAYVVIAAAKGTNTVVSATPGRLCAVVVTATGTNSMQIQDNGVTVAAIPASPGVGTRWPFQIECGHDITVVGNAANPGVTVTYTTGG